MAIWNRKPKPKPWCSKNLGERVTIKSDSCAGYGISLKLGDYEVRGLRSFEVVGTHNGLVICRLDFVCQEFDIDVVALTELKARYERANTIAQAEIAAARKAYEGVQPRCLRASRLDARANA